MQAEDLDAARALLRAKGKWKDDWQLTCRYTGEEILFRVVRQKAVSLRFRGVRKDGVVIDLVSISTSERKRIGRQMARVVGKARKQERKARAKAARMET